MSETPLGIMPRDIWDEKNRKQRLADLLQAMWRYVEADKPVPPEWVTELGELLGRAG